MKKNTKKGKKIEEKVSMSERQIGRRIRAKTKIFSTLPPKEKKGKRKLTAVKFAAGKNLHSQSGRPY